jgi:hypothetical protein
MFRCQKCNKVCNAHQPQHTIITEKRAQRYYKVIKHGPNRGQGEPVDGWEIVSEQKVCPNCYTEVTGLPARVVLAPLPQRPRK